MSTFPVIPAQAETHTHRFAALRSAFETGLQTTVRMGPGLRRDDVRS